MTGELDVRPYAPADEEACLALFDTNVPDFFRPGERDGYRSWLRDPGGPVLVVRAGHEVVAAGGVAVEADGRTGSLCWGIVRRDLHRRGVGDLLLHARLALLAGDPGCTRVRLSTIDATAPFFQRVGFTTTRVDPDGHGAGRDAWEMELVLTGSVRRSLLSRAPRSSGAPPAP